MFASPGLSRRISFTHLPREYNGNFGHVHVNSEIFDIAYSKHESPSVNTKPANPLTNTYENVKELCHEFYQSYF